MVIGLNEKILKNILIENNGILKTADAVAAGISKDYFYQFVKGTGLEKAAQGIYITADALTDEMYLLQAQFSMAVYSHEAALYLHDLAEREPTPLTVTVSASYNSGGLLKKGVRVYYVKKEWYDLGITQMASLSGHDIKVYDLERTICDIVRRCDDMDVAVFNHAVKEYVKRKDKNYAKLSHYAAALHIEKKIREKMGVLF